MTIQKYREKQLKKLNEEQKWKVIQFYAEMWEYTIKKMKSGRVKRIDEQCNGEITYFKNVDETFELALDMLWDEHCENNMRELKGYIRDILG